MILPASADVYLRLRKASDLRAFFKAIHGGTREAHARGEFPFSPPYDIRNDLEYWQRLYDQKIAG